MTARQSWRVGDLARTECNDLQGVRTTAVVAVLLVNRLNCGCDQLRVDRPGVRTEANGWKSEMALLANRCGAHANKVPAAPEWTSATAAAR